ncbi:hypothetical protein EJD97_002736, partial [Solanum chilense]
MMIICDHTNKSRRNSNERIYCRTCRNPVARVQDYILMVHPGGIFSRVRNVLVSDDVNHHFGSKIANTYCGQCGTMIGWKFIEAPRWYEYVREGRFILKLSELSFWNGVSLLHLGANEQNVDQDLGANEQNDDQGDDANEQNVDQDGDASTLIFVLLLSVVMFWNGVSLPHLNEEQYLGVNEQNDHQYLDAHEENADQDEDSTHQNEDANEQDLGVNEENADHDGGD